MDDKFTWVETYRALAKALWNFRERQNKLLDFLAGLQSEGIPTISTTDKDENDEGIPLVEIAPFTFFSNLNRGVKTGTRIEIIQRLISGWNLTCAILTICPEYL